jgi:hypothetical protein
MDVTARYLIQAALKLLGVLDPLETVEPEDAEDGLATLNDMRDAWELESLYVLTTEKASATFSGQSATIGTGGTFNVGRPVKINHAYVRYQGEDREVMVVDADRYDRIALKAQTSDFPVLLYYRRTLPLGSIVVWPVPGSLTYFLDVAIQLSEFATLDTSYEVGAGYRQALKLALAEQLAPLYDKPVSADLAKNIKRAKRMLKRSNLVVPAMRIETATPDGRGDVLTGAFPFY